MADYTIETVWSISSVLRSEIPVVQELVWPLYSDLDVFLFWVPGDLVHEQGKGKVLNFRVDETSNIVDTPITGREGGVVEYLGSNKTRFFILMKYSGSEVADIPDDLRLGEIYKIRLVRHGVHWVNCHAVLDTIVDLREAGMAGAVAYVYLVLAEEEKPEWGIQTVLRSEIPTKIESNWGITTVVSSEIL